MSHVYFGGKGGVDKYKKLMGIENTSKKEMAKKMESKTYTHSRCGKCNRFGHTHDKCGK